MDKPNIKLFTVPNVITLLNLLSGCISVVLAFQHHLQGAAILIFLAGIFDFFDGFAARLLKSYSELGKSLDSLADMVSFGVAPSAIMFSLVTITLQGIHPGFSPTGANTGELILLFSSFIIALFSALRLAKFNIDQRQSNSFIGVPTPANAFFVASLPFILSSFPASNPYILNIFVLIPLILVLSVLLVSEIPLISLKFKNFKFSTNKSRYILLTASLVLLILLKISAYPVIFILYIIISLVDQPAQQQG